MEAHGLMASTVARRLSTLASFYRYCEQEGHVERSPAAHLHRPKVDGESRTLGLDRNELSAFMVQAGIGTKRDHALASLHGLNGLRVSEALNADIDDLGFERGHHVLQIIRKGGKRATDPLAPRTARADRTVKRLARRAGINKRISPPTASGTASSPLPSMPALPCGTSRTPPAAPTLGPPALRPSPPLPRPPRHLRRRRLHRRCQPIAAGRQRRRPEHYATPDLERADRATSPDCDCINSHRSIRLKARQRGRR